ELEDGDQQETLGPWVLIVRHLPYTILPGHLTKSTFSAPPRWSSESTRKSRPCRQARQSGTPKRDAGRNLRVTLGGPGMFWGGSLRSSRERKPKSLRHLNPGQDL